MADGKPTFPQRQAEPGSSFGYTLPDGSARELKANAKGIVTPERASDVVFLDQMGVNVAQPELESLKMPALVDMAEGMGIDPKGLKKAELVDKITSAPTPTPLAVVSAPQSGGEPIETDEEKAKAEAEDAANPPAGGSEGTAEAGKSEG